MSGWLNRERIRSLARGLPDPRNCNSLQELQAALLAVYEVLGVLADDPEQPVTLIEGRNGVKVHRLEERRWLVEGEPGASEGVPGPAGPAGPPGQDGDDGGDGDNGREVELMGSDDGGGGSQSGAVGQHSIYWRYVGEDDDAWRWLITVEDGAKGDDGREVELKGEVDDSGDEDEYVISWKYVDEDEDEWRELLRFSAGGEGGIDKLIVGNLGGFGHPAVPPGGIADYTKIYDKSNDEETQLAKALRVKSGNVYLDIDKLYIGSSKTGAMAPLSYFFRSIAYSGDNVIGLALQYVIDTNFNGVAPMPIKLHTDDMIYPLGAFPYTGQAEQNDP